MTSIFETEVAEIVNDALTDFMLDATLTRDVAGGGLAYDPNPPTQVTYPCKAIESFWSRGVLANGLVDTTDVRVLVLANSLAVTPQPNDRITIRGQTYAVVPDISTGRLRPVEGDPARATWSLRCQK